ncbi:MAG: hypothetical protein J2P17_27465, partial [Mycobacterium sp.]|nr:hypothetical protein [Mycobacterium sp.]
DPAHITYRHVLAVDPTDNANVFAPEIGHADAIVGSGHYLLLASGGDSFNVFDLNHIWKMDGSTGGVGRQADGTFSASWHLWAMPRVATFSYPVTGCGTYFNDLPCITAASLDTSTTPATLVTTEGGLFDGPQDFADQTADIVRWPIDPSTGLPAQSADGLVHATARLRTHIPSIQGGTSYKGEYVFAGPCPEFVPGMYNIPSCLYKAGLDEPTRLWTRGGINLENVFYDPPTNQLWTLSESPGSRVNYFVPLHGR